MKSAFDFVRPLLPLGASVLALLLAGCGQKGPLYLGKPPPERPVAATAAIQQAGQSGAAAADSNK